MGSWLARSGSLSVEDGGGWAQKRGHPPRRQDRGPGWLACPSHILWLSRGGVHTGWPHWVLPAPCRATMKGPSAPLCRALREVKHQNPTRMEKPLAVHHLQSCCSPFNFHLTPRAENSHTVAVRHRGDQKRFPFLPES